MNHKTISERLMFVIKYLCFITLSYIIWCLDMSHDTTRQNVSSGVSDQARHKSAWAATETS